MLYFNGMRLPENRKNPARKTSLSKSQKLVSAKYKTIADPQN